MTRKSKVTFFWKKKKKKSALTAFYAKQVQFGRIKKINSQHIHKSQQMASFGQQQPTSTLLSYPNRLSNPFQSGSCQKKSCSASQTRCVCLKWIWVFLPGSKEGWPSVRLALCSGLPCELSRLRWAWTILPRSGQTDTVLLLNEITMLCPQPP